MLVGLSELDLDMSRPSQTSTYPSIRVTCRTSGGDSAAAAVCSDWQDFDGDGFNEGSQNSMINCGPTILNYGNSCFTCVSAFSLANNGANVWNNQRLIAASAALAKDVRLNLKAIACICTSGSISRTRSRDRKSVV